MDHTITVTCDGREGDVQVVYRDRHGRTTSLPWSGGALYCGALTAWDEPAVPMTAVEREQLLDDLAAWAFGSGRDSALAITHLVGTDEVPLRLPGPHGLRLHASGHVDARSGVVYMERGRSLVVLGDERAPQDGMPQLAVYLDTARPWHPHGAVATPAELATIAAALPGLPDVAVTVYASRRASGVWQLARDLESCRDSCVGLGAEAGLIAACCRRERAAPPGWFWRVELPCLYEGGRTGWTLRGQRFQLAPIRSSALQALRAQWQAAPPVPTVLLRAPGPGGPAELLVAADGNLRFFTGNRALVLLPGVDAALTALAHETVALAERLAAAVPPDTGGGDGSDLLLTPTAPRALPAAAALRDRGEHLLAGLLDHVAPLG